MPPEPGAGKELANVPGKMFDSRTVIKPEVKTAGVLITSHSSNQFAYLNHVAIKELILANCFFQSIKVVKHSDFCLTNDKTQDFSSSEGQSKKKGVNNNTVRLCPSLSDEMLNNIWQFLGIMCFLSFSGVLLPHRETKIGSASLTLFRINYSPEHCVVFSLLEFQVVNYG